ncbi:hypothetical protein NtB2_01239 [Lactococcus termiticola]|uniref:Uncharacterized protein n=1 Tax=Lactococcus termiticola TaxID=2169526 RepID=A0A2R5HGI9_9LACT|nr:hypothetical protein NtB2_01239 [Lactococcus termiticola]
MSEKFIIKNDWALLKFMDKLEWKEYQACREIRQIGRP